MFTIFIKGVVIFIVIKNCSKQTKFTGTRHHIQYIVFKYFFKISLNVLIYNTKVTIILDPCLFTEKIFKLYLNFMA